MKVNHFYLNLLYQIIMIIIFNLNIILMPLILIKITIN